MRRNQARPLPPENVRKYRRARSDASWTASSASCSFRIRQRASVRAAWRWGRTTSSKLSRFTGDSAGRSNRLFMERSEDLLDSLVERGIPEAEANPAQSDV